MAHITLKVKNTPANAKVKKTNKIMDAKDKACIFCGVREKGVIKKYGLRICRNCMRDNAYQLGFDKVD